MAILENRYRYKSKNIITLIISNNRFFYKMALILLILIVFIYSMYFSNHHLFTRWALESTGTILNHFSIIIDCVNNTVQKPLGYLKSLQHLKSENQRLILDLNNLQKLEQQAILLTHENTKLKSIINFHDEKPYNYITARLIAVNNTIYNHSAIVTVGKSQGVEVNNIVYTNRGLIGRIIEVSSNYSRVLLLTDVNSKVPVISSSSSNRAIIAGDNNKLKLLYLLEGQNIEIGELFITSGDGKYYPYGIPVAKVTHIGISNRNIFANPCIELYDTEFVKIKLTNSKNI